MRMSRSGAGVLLASIGVAAATAALMLATEPHLAITWDEGYTLGVEARFRDWFRRYAIPVGSRRDGAPPAVGGPVAARRPVAAATRSARYPAELLFDRRVVAWFWPFAREQPHGHPPFYALLGLAGDILAPSWDDLPLARLGPILLFRFTAGAIFGFAAVRWGRWAAALAAGSWVFQPNLFAHGHYAGFDATLTALWVLAILAFAQAMEPARRPRAPSRSDGAGWSPSAWSRAAPPRTS